MKRILMAFLVVTVGLVSLSVRSHRVGAQSKPAQPSTEWPTYGHDSGGMRFSPLTQITPANVNQLQVAWVYHMRPPVPTEPATPAETAAPVARTAKGPAMNAARGLRRAVSRLWL